MHVPNREIATPDAARPPVPSPLQVAVLGAGSWGTALAAAACRAGLPTRLWSRRPDVAHAIRSTGSNPRHLPGIALPRGLQASDDLQQVLAAADVVLFAVPCSAMRSVAELAGGWLPADALALATCKGVEPSSGRLMTQVLREHCAPAQPVGMLAGLSFADEVVRGLPTRLTLGMRGPGARAAGLAQVLGQAWARAGIELEICDDEVGVQVAGALKNAVAIACGMASAQELGENARAAIVARGLDDMRRLTVALGGRSETLFRSSGVADLFLTAASSHSRNTRLGLRLGASAEQRAGACDDDAELTEGAVASHALAALERRLRIELHVPRAVRDVLAGRHDAAQALQRLLSAGPGQGAGAAPARIAAHGPTGHATAREPAHEPAAPARVPGSAWHHRVVQ